MPSILNATTSSGLVTSADNSGSLQLATNNGTTAVTIDTSQNVGIGTTSPVANRKLTIGNTGAASTMRINSPTGFDAFIEFTENNSTSANTYWQIDKTPTTHAMQFWNGSERMRLNANGDLLFNSGYGSAAVAYGCRAWVNFNGTGTVAIRGSGNVSSVTDGGTGDYTINFTTAMPDANYSVTSGTVGNVNPYLRVLNYGINSASAVRMYAFFSSDNASNVIALADLDFITVAIFR
jgi:hypothetical protein